MAYNIQEMKSALNKYGGFHKSSHFYVQVTCPLLATDPVNGDLIYLCESATLPGLHFDTVSVRPMGYGLQEKRPTDFIAPEFRCDFFVDNNAASLSYFQKWMTNILNFGADVRAATNNPTSLNYYEFAYPKEYEGTINLYVLDGTADESGKPNIVTTYTLYNAFPVNIGDVTVAWEMNDQVSKFPVTFAYRTFATDATTKSYNQPAREIGQIVKFPITLNPGVIESALQNQNQQPGLIEKSINAIGNLFK